MYYLYHIPGKKIGVTRNLNHRVTLIQGYKENEYEVLEQSPDIDYISDKEIELQKSYGYKVDRKLYKNLFNNMKINVTSTTSTFAIPLNKLKGHLMDNMDLSWDTEHGTFKLDMSSIQWIMKYAKTSMYNDKRSYIYNKAFAEYFKPKMFGGGEGTDTLSVFHKIREWAQDRGLYEKGDPMVQYVKLQEECGELAKALLERDEPEVIDAIGDIVVVLTNLAHQKGYKIEDCINTAYRVINQRTGKMINGTFVKDEK
jgi:NTP pyrophosphatase (non-canonical NTP hydrolase)